jgi:hypothetical protein
MPQSLSHLLAATRATVMSGPGLTDPALRDQVAHGRPPADLEVLVEKIRDHAYTVTDEELKALGARYSEDQLFELIVAAAIGAAESRLTAALAALEQA